MANSLLQDPLFFDASATDVECPRIRAVKFDNGGGSGSASIVDATTSHILWSTDITCFDEINLTVPTPYLIDVTVSGGVVYIYLGSGPR